MSSKGASNRYGNTKGKPSKHINYQWAKDFNDDTSMKHFVKHESKFFSPSEEEYIKSAMTFANTVSLFHKMFVDRKGSTYKYDPRTGKLAIIDKRGYIISYFTVEEKQFQHIRNEKEK